MKFDSLWTRKNKTSCIEQGSEHLVGEIELTDVDLETVYGGGGGRQSSSPCSSSSHPGQGTPQPAGNSNSQPSGNSNDYSNTGYNGGNSSDGGYNAPVPSTLQMSMDVMPGCGCFCRSY